MKILITGIAGFIGSHTAERLHELGHEVVGLDNFSDYYAVALKRQNAKALSDKGILVIQQDLRSDDLASSLPIDIDYVFHFAAQPGLAMTCTFNDYLANNVLATQNLLEYVLQFTNIKMFVNIGTSSIYGLQATCTEEEASNPASNYGVTKLAAEQLALSKSRLGELPACSLRLYSVYGSRERPDKLFTKLIDCALHNKKFPLFKGSLDHLRSFTHIKDIVDGIVSVMGKEHICDGQVFNIGTEDEYTTQQGIDVVEELLNTKIEFEILPPRFGDQKRTNANIAKARRMLGYHPTISLKQGVAEQIGWYKNSIMD